MKTRASIIGIVMLLALLCATALNAQDGLNGALSRDAGSAQAVSGLFARTVAADFDNDQKPDGAILVETGRRNGQRAFRIELHVSAGSDNAITFSSAESGLAISALDVNQDGAPDIVVEKPFTRQWVQVFLNDGHGNFRKAKTDDFPSPDPAAPGWRTRLTQCPPVLCLPLSRSSETQILQHASIHPRDPSRRFRFWSEGFLAQSAARAPSSSRAPPSLLTV